MRGTVSGAFWGLVLGTTGLGIASLVHEQPVPANSPQMPQIAAPQPAEGEVIAVPLVQDAPDPVSSVATDAPRMTPPQDVAEQAVVDAEPAAPPPAVVDGPAPSEPVTIAPETDVAAAVTTQDNGTVTNIAPKAPPAPVAEDMDPPAEIAATAEDPPAQTPAPGIVDTPSKAPAAQDTADLAAPVPAPNVAPEPAPQTAVVGGPDTDPPAPVTPPAVAPVNDATVGTGLAREPRAMAEMPADVMPEPVPAQPDVDTGVGLATGPVEDASDVAPEPAPQIVAETASPLPSIGSGVQVNRPGVDVVPSVGIPSEIAVPDVADEDVAPLTRYAAAFENPQDLPLVSIVLLDDGTLPDAAAAVAALPFAATVILDPLDAGAAERMAAYRAAGIEVGLQVALPFGARAQDVEVAFQAAFAMVPESVVMFSGGEDLLQSDRSVTGQVVAVLAAEGLGLIAVERGLNNVARIAEAAGVPAATVLRSLDEGNDAAAVGRALDQAAFRARQGTEGIVVIAGATPDMLDMLADWALGGPVDQVALAPASALLIQP